MYDISLVLDINNVGENFASIPIKAECILPIVKIELGASLDYGEVYIEYL